MLTFEQKKKIKNLRTIGLNLIAEFQRKSEYVNLLNDPRGIMSDLNVACSLFRKQLRNGCVLESYCPKSVRNKNFYDLVDTLKVIIEKQKKIIKNSKVL